MTRPQPLFRSPDDMEFDKRIQRAIARGKHTQQVRAREAAAQALSEEELRRLHGQYRLELSEYIEQCLKHLPDHLPGFRYETVHGERGWGAAVARDDIAVGAGARRSLFSRLEMTVRPISSYAILELAAKATVRNREIFSRTHYQRLADVDLAMFRETVDLWAAEFAELYVASS